MDTYASQGFPDLFCSEEHTLPLDIVRDSTCLETLLIVAFQFLFVLFTKPFLSFLRRDGVPGYGKETTIIFADGGYMVTDLENKQQVANCAKKCVVI